MLVKLTNGIRFEWEPKTMQGSGASKKMNINNWILVFFVFVDDSYHIGKREQALNIVLTNSNFETSKNCGVCMQNKVHIINQMMIFFESDVSNQIFFDCVCVSVCVGAKNVFESKHHEIPIQSNTFASMLNFMMISFDLESSILLCPLHKQKSNDSDSDSERVFQMINWVAYVCVFGCLLLPLWFFTISFSSLMDSSLMRHNWNWMLRVKVLSLGLVWCANER